jgi:chromosome segregation ATPase
MFGKIIISESEYNELTRIKKEAEERIQNVIDGRKKIERDCASLREQLSDKMQEINKLRDLNNRLKSQNKSLSEFRRDTLEAMGQVDLAGFRLSYCTKKCEHCTSKHTDCRKYKFGSHEYCVIPK